MVLNKLEQSMNETNISRIIIEIEKDKSICILFFDFNIFMIPKKSLYYIY